MSSERFVLLGLAPARQPWFTAVAQWATSATIAAEFIKCVSADEVRSRLSSGRVHSALLVDAGLPAFDRDLVAAALASTTPVIAISDGRGPAWSASDIGVAAVLGATFTPSELLGALNSNCRPVGRGDQLPTILDDRPAPRWRGRLIGVCGPGGTGSSTVAIALAQALANDPRYGRRVLLADLALHADQAMLHDTGEIGPGVQELVEAHRLGRPEPEDIHRTTFDVSRRGYRLLLGMRRPEAWSSLRPRAIEAAVDGLRQTFQAVVADVTGDLEGEAQGGSMDVEERNQMARVTVQRADIVVAVGAPGMKGAHSLASLIRAVAAAGAAPERILPVLNRAPRHPGARADIARAVATLSAGPSGSPSTAIAGLVFVPERKVEDALRSGAPLPGPLVTPLERAVEAVLRRLADAPPAREQPERIAPGSLGVAGPRAGT